MHSLTHTPSPTFNGGQPCVEIRIWEVYFKTHRKNLLDTLSAYAVGGAPLPEKSNCGAWSFRFLNFDWENKINPLMLYHQVPFELVKTFTMDVLHDTPKKKVYLVEDDLEILFAMNIMLEEAGYDVLLSHCAKPLMEEHLPYTDLFILDKSMPDGDGLEVYGKLRRSVDTRNTPVIMISCFREARAQALRAGVDEFLEKPFDVHELLKIVAKHIN